MITINKYKDGDKVKWGRHTYTEKKGEFYNEKGEKVTLRARKRHLKERLEKNKNKEYISNLGAVGGNKIIKDHNGIVEVDRSFFVGNDFYEKRGDKWYRKKSRASTGGEEVTDQTTIDELEEMSKKLRTNQTTLRLLKSTNLLAKTKPTPKTNTPLATLTTPALTTPTKKPSTTTSSSTSASSTATSSTATSSPVATTSSLTTRQTSRQTVDFDNIAQEFGFTDLVTNDKSSIAALLKALNQYIGNTTPAGGSFRRIKEDGIIGKETLGALRAAKDRILSSDSTLDAFYNSADNFDLNKLLKLGNLLQPVTQQVNQQQTNRQQTNRQNVGQVEQFRGAPFYVLDENMLNKSSVKDYDSLLDYMYNNPTSSFTKGFMNMVYSNMGSSLDYWDPNQESQWNYLRRNKKLIEKIAGVKGRYGNGLLGTSGDYQDLIRSINGYAKEANRGIMYNKPQLQGYTPYNVYPNQLIPTMLATQLPAITQTSNNMVNINGENLLLGQGWGVRNGQVYDQTGKLRIWSPQEQRFLRKGGNISKYQTGGTTNFPPYTKYKIGRLNSNQKNAFLLDNNLNLNDKNSIIDLQNRINAALQGLGYTNKDFITVDGKLGKLTVSTYDFLKKIWNDRSGYNFDADKIGGYFDNLFGKSNAEINTPANPPSTTTTTSTTTTATLRPLAVSPQQYSVELLYQYTPTDKNFLVGKGVKDYNTMLDYMYANPNSDFSRKMANFINTEFGSSGITSDNYFDFLRLNQKAIEKKLGVRGRYGRGLFGGGDLQDLVRNLDGYMQEANRGYSYNKRGGWNGFLPNQFSATYYLTQPQSTLPQQSAQPQSAARPSQPTLTQPQNPAQYYLFGYPTGPAPVIDDTRIYYNGANPSRIQRAQQGGQLSDSQKKEQEEFAKFLVEKSGAKTQKELESFVKEQGEEGMKKLYTEFKNKKKQKAKHGLKLKYIDNLKKGSVLAGCGAKIKKNCFGKKLGKGGKNCGCKE